MDRNIDIEIVDLGTVTGETQGLPGSSNEVMGQHKPTGISDLD